MTSAELLADAFGRVQETVHEAVEGLTASQLTARLDDDANSIAWLCWHLARVQDDHVAGAFGVPQVWLEYGKRFELPFEPSDIGYGHSSGQVSEVTVSSPDLLVGYHDAVHEQTIRLVSDIDRRGPDPGRGRGVGSACDAERPARQRDLRLPAARWPGRLHPRRPAAVSAPRLARPRAAHGIRGPLRGHPITCRHPICDSLKGMACYPFSQCGLRGTMPP